MLQHARDYLPTWAANGAALGISFSTVENSLKLLSLLLAIGFTIWQWRVKHRDLRPTPSDCPHSTDGVCPHINP